MAFLASDNTASPVNGVVSGTARADESSSSHLDISVNLDPLKQKEKKMASGQQRLAPQPVNRRILSRLNDQEMTWKRGEKMDGWKKMTLLPLSTANEKIKNKTGLVRQSNDVTSLEQCQKEQGSNRPLTCANSGGDVTASC